jgi:hypothetical protein
MVKGSKNSYMRDETFAELMDSARQALAYESGAREDYRVTRVEIPVSTKKISVGKAIPQGSIPKYHRKHKKVLGQG